MKNTILIILGLITAGVIANADLRGSPFQPHDDRRYNESEGLASAEIFVGDSAGARSEVAVTGDITISNTGVTALGAGVIVAADITLTDAQLFVGNGSNVAADVALSGDATLANTGALTIAAGAVEESMLEAIVDGRNAMRVAKANLDCGVSSCVAGTVSMVTTLPANAVIFQTFWRTETQFVDGGAGTVAFHCEDADNLFAAADITGNADGSFVAGVQLGTIATMTGAIAAQCIITATIAVAEQTAGVLSLYVLYMLHD